MARARTRAPEPSLAERRGLVKVVPRVVQPAVSNDEWMTMERNITARNEAYCPICLEGFAQGHEVLLSCSHMFHRMCLQNFEQFMRRSERSCPICRTGNYQKKITHVGSRAFEQVCAGKLQALWRAYCVRKVHYHTRRNLYRGASLDTHTDINPGLRSKFYQGELSQIATRMESFGEKQGAVVDRVLTSSDQTIRESRELDTLFEMMMQSRCTGAGAGASVDFSSGEDAKEGKEDEDVNKKGRGVDWDGALERALKRGLGECVVCLGPLATSTRIVTLLSCSHALHEACVHSLERYAGANEALLCCVCRTPYHRRCLDKTCTRFT